MYLGSCMTLSSLLYIAINGIGEGCIAIDTVRFIITELKNMPPMTVIVPAFNSEATMDACLAAIRRSTYRNYELIVVDDGSRDQTAWIAARHADKVLRFDANRGSAEARN